MKEIYVWVHGVSQYMTHLKSHLDLENYDDGDNVRFSGLIVGRFQRAGKGKHSCHAK